MTELTAATQGITVVLGYPEYVDGEIFNSAAVLAEGRHVASYRKHCLPNYAVFDEQRYFSPGDEALVVEVAGTRVGITICEDVWEIEPCRLAAAAGAELIVSINGSPFRAGKQGLREAVLAERCRDVGLPLVYQNVTGGQDELVFDGGSCVLSAEGVTTVRAPAFEAGLYYADFALDNGALSAATWSHGAVVCG